MGNHYSENKMKEFASADEQRIVELLSGLDRIGAPADFNFRVKSRIAAGPVPVRSWFPGALKLAFPVLLLMTIFGLLLMRDPSSSATHEVAAIDEVKLVPSVVSQEPEVSIPVQSVSQPSNGLPAAKVNERQMNALATQQPQRGTNVIRAAVRRGEQEPVASSGSFDFSANVSHGIALPANSSVSKPLPSPKSEDRPLRLSATGVFALMGLKGSFSGSEFTVQSILSGSAAEQAGIKVGDVLESINGQPLSSSPTFSHDLTGGTLRVRRSGAVVTINVGQ